MNLQKLEKPDPFAGVGRVEKLIMQVFPRWGLQRFFFRKKLEVASRAYESIELSRLRRQRQDARSADQINSISVDKLRLQARYLDENHDLARSVLNTLVSQIVGGGLLTFPMPKNLNGEVLTDLADSITTLWEDWSKVPEVTWENSWGKVQQLAVRSWFRDGEVFAQLLLGNVPGLDHGTEIKFSLEQLEADYVPLGLNDSTKGVRQGIQKNVWGRPNTYWVFKNYPTEGAGDGILNSVLSTVGFSIGFDDVKGIIARNMVHLKHADRIRQTRGASIFASVFTRLDDLKDYEESERIAARIGAAFALAINKSVDGTPGATTSEAAFREMEIAPGIIADTLAPGETVASIKNERPDNKLIDFRQSQLRAVAAGTNTGYSNIAKDYEGSYSSQRQELVEQARTYATVRGEFISVFVKPIYTAFVNMAVTQNLIDVSGVDPLTLFDADHVGLGTPYIEPKRESDADLLTVQAGIKSLTRVQLDRGLDPREMHRQLVDERAKQSESGLVLSSDTGATVAAEAAANPPPTNDAPADNDDADRYDYVLGNKYEDDETGLVYEFTKDGFRLINLDMADIA